MCFYCYQFLHTINWGTVCPLIPEECYTTAQLEKKFLQPTRSKCLGWQDSQLRFHSLSPLLLTPPPSPNFDAIDLGNSTRGTIDFLRPRLSLDPIYRPAVPALLPIITDSR